MTGPFEERVARNEALFRQVNEEIARLAPRLAPFAPGPVGFLCECGDGDCTSEVDVPVDVYERIRGNPRRFVVLPTHVVPEIEHVVERADRYSIVEKDTPTAIRIVERHDPRSRDEGRAKP